jgi:hypothetical protein
MTVDDLTAQEKRLIASCLIEAVNGPYFPDWEFHTLVGAKRPEIREIAASWLAGEQVTPEAVLLTQSVLNNLRGYPHGQAAGLERVTGASPAALESLSATLSACDP